MQDRESENLRFSSTLRFGAIRYDRSELKREMPPRHDSQQQRQLRIWHAMDSDCGLVDRT